MYDFEWHTKSRAYKLLTKTGKFVASEIRPVYAEELDLFGAKEVFAYDAAEQRPLLWGKHNSYIYKGEEVAKIQKDESGAYKVVPTTEKKIRLDPVDIELWISINQKIMEALVADTLKRIKEMYDAYRDKTDVCYIGFSGGKDSMVLLDLCHRVLPLNVPVVYSDTDMELPDSYETWKLVKKRYEGRPFKMVRAAASAVDNWASFGPPSKSLRWCCAVHKSVPAIMYFRKLAGKPATKTLAFVGVRSDESIRRSSYDDIGDGLKSQSQVNAMPILGWGAQELHLYTYANELLINGAYRNGLSRVGCILCPMSNGRNDYIVRRVYPCETKRLADVVRTTIERSFDSEAAAEKFLFDDCGWHARQSGVSLKNVIQIPQVVRKNGRYTFSFSPVNDFSLLEWLKTIAPLVGGDLDDQYRLVAKNPISIALIRKENLVVGIDAVPDGGILDKSVQKYVRSSICKALGCVSCRACETECPTGALSFEDGIKIDLSKCVHCMRCHVFNDGCLRYFSLRYAGGTNMNISGINKYMNFGLKREWVDVLIEERENFRTTSALGTRMVPSAITWFREASLLQNEIAVIPTKLLDVAANAGAGEDNDVLWSMMWISLVNKSPLMKWFVCSTEIGKDFSIEELNLILHRSVASDTVCKGALQSLCSTFKTSPLGTGTNPMVGVESKGVRVLSLTRRQRSIDPFALLYSLYLIGKLADRTSFTISEMMTADFDSPFISPLVAFGMSPEEFKAQCLGVSTVHPDFLSCSFTLGLDEVKIFPNEKTVDDVLGLILGE